jgi:CheY-like chemotaxis protein
MDIATTGTEAIGLVRTGHYDLLLIDMHLPDTDGIDLLAALRCTPGLLAVPAIMVSAGAREQDLERALASGFTAYWTKPLDIERVLAALDAFLAPGPAQA